MRNPKKAPIVLGIAAVAILVLIWITATVGKPSTSTKPTPAPSHSSTSTPAADPSPTAAAGTPAGTDPSPSPSPVAHIGIASFTKPLGAQSAIAAAAAAQFTGTDTHAQRQQAYTAAGLTPELAASFAPIWTRVFDAPDVGKAHIAATGETMFAASVSVLDTPEVTVESATGAPGHQAFTVAVVVTVQPTWSTSTGDRHIPSRFDATWQVTIDEASGKITAIQQPDPADIPFQPAA